jgi:hypothetical protein
VDRRADGASGRRRARVALDEIIERGRREPRIEADRRRCSWPRAPGERRAQIRSISSLLNDRGSALHIDDVHALYAPRRMRESSSRSDDRRAAMKRGSGVSRSRSRGCRLGEDPSIREASLLTGSEISPTSPSAARASPHENAW